MFVYDVNYGLSGEKKKKSRIKGQYVDIFWKKEKIHIEPYQEKWKYTYKDELQEMAYKDQKDIDGLEVSVNRRKSRVPQVIMIVILLFSIAILCANFIMLHDFETNNDEIKPYEMQGITEMPETIGQSAEQEGNETGKEETELNESIQITAEQDLDLYIQEHEDSIKNDVYIGWNDYTQDAEMRRWLVQDDTISEFGINVSYYQGEIDWEQVKDFGVDFAIVRIGYRGTESGVFSMDVKYDEYMKGAEECGIKLGTYVYSQAITLEEMKEEVDACLSAMDNYDISYPVAIELDRTDGVRTSQLTDEEYINLIKYFCIEMKNHGYTPMIYNSVDGFYEIQEGTFDGYYKWVYSASSKLDEGIEDCIVWQYRQYVYIPGVENKVSINIGGMPYINK